MIDKELEKAINSQINYELYSAYLYLAMSAYFSDMQLNGFANWMHVQAQEEMCHAMKFYYFVVDKDGQVALEAIQAPKASWNSPLEVIEDAYKHELSVTSRISAIVEIARAKKDYTATNMLDWFLNEQIEEEANELEIAKRLKLIGKSPDALLTLDAQLGRRAFAMPAGAPIKGNGAVFAGGISMAALGGAGAAP
jgi:ferritin